MKLHFKYICALLLNLIPGAIAAQNNECHEFEAAYVLMASGSSRITGDAFVEFQENAFHMKGNGIEAYCDGSSIWTVDSKAKEVYIETVSPDSEAYMKDWAPKLAAMTAGSEASFDLPDGMKLHIEMKSMKKTAGKDISSFRPACEFDSSWVITDLR